MLTLISDAPAPAAAAPAGYAVRGCRRSDIEALGKLYFEAYDPGQACGSLDEAVADIEASFAGEYGPLWPEASLLATTDYGEPAAAILVVERAPWPDTPACPFIIELFTDRGHRGRGVARWLVASVLDLASATGVALRVADDNHRALGLYRSLGFRQWSPNPPVTAP